MKETVEFEVHIHEAGPDSKARVKSIFNYMQTAADLHSRNIGTSLSSMAENNLTWVYSRFYMEIDKYPELYEKIQCQTWRSVIINNFVCREFLIFAGDNSIMVRATSSLALIDRTSRKPVLIPEIITSQLENDKNKSITFPAGNIEFPAIFDYSTSMKTRYEEIDINGHMNNASYAGLFFESVFEKLKVPMKLKSIDITFRDEILYGDELECEVISINNPSCKYQQKLYNKTKGKTSAYAVTEWVNNL